MNYAVAIKGSRERAGLSVDDLATAVGLDVRVLCEIERGDIDADGISGGLIDRVAAALGVRPLAVLLMAVEARDLPGGASDLTRMFPVVAELWGERGRLASQ